MLWRQPYRMIEACADEVGYTLIMLRRGALPIHCLGRQAVILLHALIRLGTILARVGRRTPDVRTYAWGAACRIGYAELLAVSFEVVSGHRHPVKLDVTGIGFTS